MQQPLWHSKQFYSVNKTNEHQPHHKCKRAVNGLAKSQLQPGPTSLQCQTSQAVSGWYAVQQLLAESISWQQLHQEAACMHQESCTLGVHFRNRRLLVVSAHSSPT